MSDSKNSVARTLTVAVVTSLFCSALVTSVAIGLKPIQQQNIVLNQQRNILAVVGLLDEDRPVQEQFEVIETRIVDLESGEYDEAIDPDSFDPERAAMDPATRVTLSEEDDIARVRQRASHAPVYLVRENGEVKQIILPVHGAGLWGVMKGFLAMERDGNTIHGLKFHEHVETPGLGDQIDNPRWRSLWEGKLAFDANGEPQIEVIRGAVAANAQDHSPPRAGDPSFQVDGMSGATLTGRGVSNIVRFWLGPQGFGPYLKKNWLNES